MHGVADRPDRFEPRAKKRRRNHYADVRSVNVTDENRDGLPEELERRLKNGLRGS
jgi:hypothetical protein